MDYRIEQLRYLLREDPSSRIFYQLGELLRREGETDQAVEVLRSGLERHPRYVAAWVCLGRSQRDLEALEEAKQAFETALEIDRENPVAARLLGETAVEREDWLGAVKALKLSRALTGADAALDAQIAMVEAELDEDGRLELKPVGLARPTTPPERCLEVVNFSADDPFSAVSEDAETQVELDDVFSTTEAPADTFADEITQVSEPPAEIEPAVDEVAETAPESGIEVSEETVSDEVVEIEDAVTAEIDVIEPDELEADEEGFVTAEPEVVDDPDGIPIVESPMVDESSVGAWSTSMSVAGSAGEQAWTEPVGELVTEDSAPGDDPWAEPSAALEQMEEPEAETPGAVEPITDDDLPQEGEPVEIPTEMDHQPEEAVADVGEEDEDHDHADEIEPRPETQEFDSIEVTHPVVIEKRNADAEEQVRAEADEQPVREEAGSDYVAPVDDDVLPGEDRGSDAIEVTRPIPLPDQPIADRAVPEPDGAQTLPPIAEVRDEKVAEDRVEITDRRHELEHGVPLPTMTLAKLALEQDDRPLAMATLESLIERDPANTEAIAMLDELSAREDTAAQEKLQAVRATTKIAALQGWLDAVRLAAERRVQ